jgi:hypothetical protein
MAHNWFIDCREERDRFERLLTFDESKRVMAIEAESGLGKSHLVRRLHDDCMRADPRVPAALIDFKETRANDPVTLVEEIAEQMQGEVDLDQFFELLSERDLGTYGSSRGVVDMRAADLTDAHDNQFSGQRFEAQNMVVNAGGGVRELSRRQLSGADRDVIKEFFRALSEHCREAPAAILMDSYETCHEELAEWWELRLNPYFFDAGRRPAQLVHVVAGIRVPAFNFSDAKREETLIHVPELKRWERDDIVAGLRDVGYEEPPPQVEHLYPLLETDIPPGTLIGVLNGLVGEG